MTQPGSKPSPLRGVAIAFVALLVFFPAFRHTIGHLLGIIIALVVGGVVTAAVLSLCGMRR